MVETHRLHCTSPNINLKIKSEDGNHTFLLKMCLSETIGHLRRYLDTHRWEHTSLQLDSFPNTPVFCVRGSRLSGYDIINVHPRRCYRDESQMLGSCGFTRNTTLLLQTRKGWQLFVIHREESHLQEIPNVKQVMKIFISKICKYKQGQKYENIKHLFPFAKNIWDVKACGSLIYDESCADFFLKKFHYNKKWLMFSCIVQNNCCCIL